MDSDPASAMYQAEQAIRDYNDTDNLICLNVALSGFQFALKKSDNQTLSLTSLVGLSATYGYLADIDEAACIEHAQRAVQFAERALALYQEAIPNDLSFRARIHDVLGYALLRRYTCLGDEDDCNRAIEAGRAALEYTDSNAPPSAKTERQYHLATACYMLARRASALMLRCQDSQYLMEAQHMISLATKLDDQNTKYLLLWCKVWWLTVEHYRNRIPHDRYMDSERPAGGNHSPDSAISGSKFKLHDILNDPIAIARARVAISSYIGVYTLGRSSHILVASRLGFFSAALVSYTQRGGDSDNFYACGREILKTIQDESFKIDLRHATLLRDILVALVRCRCMLNMRLTGLIEEVGRRLDMMLPQSHVERPDLHYLLGLSLCQDQIMHLIPRNRSLNWLPVIEQYRAALKSTPDGHPSQVEYLSRLVSTLRSSAIPGYSSTDEARILSQEARCWEGVLTALNQPHEAGSDVHELVATGLDTAHEAIRAGARLDIAVFEGILGLLKRHYEPAQKRGRRSLSNRQLAGLLNSMSVITHRYRSITAHPGYIDDLVRIWRLARNRPPDTHVTRSILDFGLGSALSLQATLRGLTGSRETDEIYQLLTYGITYMQKSMTNQTPTTPTDFRKRTIIGDTFVYRHELNTLLNGNYQDLETAIAIFRDAVAQATSLKLDPNTIRFISDSWVRCASTLGHNSVVEAFGLLISASAQSAWVGQDLQARCDGIRLTGNTSVADGMAYACQHGMPGRAVEFLETGCSILFSRTLPLRNRHAELYATNPDLALKLEQLGKAIHERSIQCTETLQDTVDAGSMTSADERIKSNYELRYLGSEWEDLLLQIRTIEGHENFLQTPSLEKLCQAAARGPVVLVISSQVNNACYAIVIPYPVVNDIRWTKLHLSARDAQKLSDEFKDALVQRALRMRSPVGNEVDARGLIMRMAGTERLEDKAHKVFAQLWSGVMNPIIDLLYQCLKLDKKYKVLS